MRRRANIFVRLFDAMKDFILRKPFRSVVSAVLIAAVFAGVIVAYFQNSPGGTVFYYVEDNELYRANGTNSGTPVSGRFITGSAAASSESAELLIPGLVRFVTESGSGRYIYYPDNNSAEDPSVTLYCRRIDGSGEPVRIDSGVTKVVPSSKNHSIIYEKADALYRFSPSGGTEALVYGFKDYIATGSLDVIAYIDASGNLFLKSGNRAPEEIDRDATSVGAILAGGTVWYVKNEVLYKKAPGSDKVKITSDAYEKGFIQKKNSGSFYFLTYERMVDVAYDLLRDDLLGSDSAMTEPSEPVLPSRSAYPSSEEYEAAMSRYNQNYERYQRDLAEYAAKLSRDELRSQLRTTNIVRARVTLNYCEGEKITPVCRDIYAGDDAFEYDRAGNAPGSSSDGISESVTGSGSGSGSGDSAKSSAPENGAPEGIFSPIPGGADSVAYFKIKESEPVMAALEDFSDLQSAARAAENTRGSAYELEFAKGARKLYTDSRVCPAGGFSKDGKTFCYLAPEADQTPETELYAVHEADLSKLTDTVVDKNVSSVGFIPSDCLYFKEVNVERGRGILYFKGKKIAEDVTLGSPVASAGAVYYFTDYSGNRSGTLWRYGGRKSRKVADDVHAFAVTGSGSVVFSGDYRGAGRNKLYFGSERNVVTENVSGIFAK